MQELQPIPGLEGRLFGGGGGGGAANTAATGLLRRRVGPATPGAAEVRCPRCDSANTKFCYYNNYNLAQPRHFCKACRRYWTKGGLLRNVPVGGGCRKPKPKPKRPAAADAGADAGRNGDGAHRDAKNPRSGFVGASSSAADATVTSDSSSVATQPSVPRSSTAKDISATTGPFPASGDTLHVPVPLPPPAPMFADQAAAFASLFTPPQPAFCFSAHPMAEGGVATVLPEQPSPHSTAAAPDSTPFPVRSGGGLAAGASDWPPSASDAAIFELTGGITGNASLPAYWNPGCWTEPDPTIYLP